MSEDQIPRLGDSEIDEWLTRAAESPRRRVPNILHAPGDEFNRVVNFMLHDSYMQPHLHPGDEKIERIYPLRGKLAVLFFDDTGAVERVVTAERGGVECVEVPAFTWHTYVMLTDSVVTYETMMGEYEPKTWKEMAQWAPAEGTREAERYLAGLKEQARNPTGQLDQ